MAEIRERLYVYVNPEMMEKIREYSRKLGLTLSQFSNLCITAGMNAVIRAVEPEKILSVEDWQRIMEAGQRAGLPVEEMKKLKLEE